jgi:neutral ceramidase
MMLSPIARFIFALLVLAPSISSAAKFRAGAATSNITPEIGLEIVGGFVPSPSKTIHDELHARCLVLDDGNTRLALVVCDLLGIDRKVSTEARKIIAEREGIPPECVLISATHTHSASSVLGQARFKLEQDMDDYQRFVARRIADGVTRAVHQLRPAEIAFGTAEAPEHVFNRRWHMRPGTAPVNPFGQVESVKMNPPAVSDNLIEPAGPTDPTVSFFAVRDIDGRPLSIYAAYSLHYVGGTGSGHISADYFAVFSEHLKELVVAKHAFEAGSPAFVAMMANGTSGDINNINFREPRPKMAAYEKIRMVGKDVAEKVFTTLESLEYRSDVTLSAVYREPTIVWRKPTAELRQWAKETLAAGKRSEGDLSYIYAGRTMNLDEYPETTTVPLQLFRINDVSIGTMPFEVFCEIGLDFKARCPGGRGFMVELAHGYFGYLPSPRHFNLGGYETWIGTNRVEPLASEKLLDELLDMASP